MFRGTMLVFVLLVGCAAQGQTPEGPAFDAASIKPAGDPGGIGRAPSVVRLRVGPGSVTLQYFSLMECIRWAYNVNAQQISGPAWLNSQRFDIIAKAASRSTEAQLRAMMQHLLAERFKMKLHRDSKEFNVLTLTIAKGGTKCKPSEGDGEMGFGSKGQGAIAVSHATSAQLAAALADILGQPVVDKTGLQGHYDCSMDMRSYVPESGTEPDVIGLITAVLREQMGLGVSSRKTPLPVYVIEHIEKMPTAN